MRGASLLQRKWRSGVECRRTLGQFDVSRREILDRLPAPRPVTGRLLIIRLDDIGDYVLFRNHLPMFKLSPRWKDHAITLLGNAAWRPLFEELDGDAVDQVIWADKAAYLCSADYRRELWVRLRKQGFSTVIAPSRTRPLMLDDASLLAAAPTHAIASPNTHVHAAWNAVSDALYDELVPTLDEHAHEFHFNGEFAARCCGRRFGGSRPYIRPMPGHLDSPPYILCFVGANTRSKRWPWWRWTEFLRMDAGGLQQSAVLAGHGRSESDLARRVAERTNVRSIVGATSLTEVLRWIGGASAVISNDTMAAHLGVSANRPTVIVANGVNHLRFTEYGRARIGNVVSVYPPVFERWRDRRGLRNYDYTQAVSADIAAIRADRVHRALDDLLHSGHRWAACEAPAPQQAFGRDLRARPNASSLRSMHLP